MCFVLQAGSLTQHFPRSIGLSRTYINLEGVAAKLSRKDGVDVLDIEAEYHCCITYIQCNSANIRAALILFEHVREFYSQIGLATALVIRYLQSHIYSILLRALDV